MMRGGWKLWSRFDPTRFLGGRRRELDGMGWQELSGSFRRKLIEVVCVVGN
jgi:hypothetical protein